MEVLPRVETVPLWTLAVVAIEMVPLVPTQPLALASGLLFGPVEGAFVIWAGYVIAATASLSLARGAGRTIASKVIKEETAEAAGDDEGFQKKWNELQSKLMEGNFAQKVGVITLYRLAPHPFSASNYLFAFTKLSMSPYVIGTMLGMAPWAVFFSTVGATGRTLLSNGEEMAQVFVDLSIELEGPIKTVGDVAIAVGLSFALYAGVNKAREQGRSMRERGLQGSIDE